MVSKLMYDEGMQLFFVPLFPGYLIIISVQDSTMNATVACQMRYSLRLGSYTIDDVTNQSTIYRLHIQYTTYSIYGLRAL